MGRGEQLSAPLLFFLIRGFSLTLLVDFFVVCPLVGIFFSLEVLIEIHLFYLLFSPLSWPLCLS